MNRHRRHRCRGACLLLTLAVSLAGCTSPVKFTPSGGAQDFPPYEGEVRVLEKMPDARQFDRIGVVVVEGVQLTADAAMVDAIRNKAADNGANAVVMQGPVKVTRDSAGGVKKTLAAWAIRLKR